MTAERNAIVYLETMAPQEVTIYVASSSVISCLTNC